ncbi:MAG TPA: phage major capsid protein, partial [Nocardioidaceae bacterium]|nr:phage major capsid protein [Nocardioidaceae bacterium]
MATSKQLREQRASIWEQMKEVMASPAGENGALSGEQEQKYDRLETAYDKLDTDIERQERFEAADVANSKVDRSGVMPPADSNDLGDEPEKGYTEAFARWMRNGVGGLDRDDQKVLQAGFVKDDAIRNAQGVGTGAAGGYTVPPAFRAKIIEQINYVAAMRQLAEVISTETGADLPWPTVDDTANEGAILAENTQATEQDVVFGTNNIGAYMYTSKIVRASLQLLNDNAFDFERWLAGALGRRIGRVQNRHFTVGTGVGQPDGIITSAAVGVTAAAAAAVTYDELVDLSESIDQTYLDGDEVGWMFNQTTRKLFRKLKDGNQRPIWEPSMQAGTPGLLLGYPTRINNYVPAPAASAKSILFGNVREAYLVRDVQEFALLRLSERYADFLQVG